jgi:acyl-CoA synthetase (AMP-forming)/AMP-acid ligase II
VSRPDPAPEAMHYAGLWEAIAAEIPASRALVQGDRAVTWREFEDRAARVAGALRDEGIGVGATVALYLYNCPEYFEIFFGALKMRAVPANVNYRYTRAELQALLANSDAEALFFDAALADRVAPALAGTKVRLLVEVGGAGSGYEKLIESHVPMPPIPRAATDVFLSYTGGTTGLPKGVLYDIGRGVGTTVVLRDQFLDQTTQLGIVDFAVQRARSSSPLRAVPAAPLMHSTGFTYASLPTLTAGGTVVMLESRSFDADELFRTVTRHRPQVIAIVGDAFALPMVSALDRAAAAGTPYDTSSLTTICSAGTAWSGPVKERLLEHIPQVALFDACGCTEGVTYGRRRIANGDAASTANFEAAPGLLVLSTDRRPLPPGQVGLLAGPTPAAGYFKDPEKTRAVFFERDGQMYALPGDYGRIEADGTVTLVGRGTTVVNTGGEKVFPAEVEEVIKEIDGVYDCVVLGVPDPRFGQAVAAVVARQPGSTVSQKDVVSTVRRALAAYKVPRLVRFVESVPRAPNGKVDYPAAARMAGAGSDGS